MTSQIFSGEYHSAFKGKGMAFSEVRDYAIGDEIRTIDWNVTARFNEPFVKVFEEERELTVMLIVDISNSGMFGTKNVLKRELITELCAVLAFSAASNKDRIGLIMFSDKVEKYIPPKKGKSHVLRLIRELIYAEPTGKSTNITEAMKFFSKMVKKKSTAFLLSDFRSTDYNDAIKIASRKHDLIALKFNDQAETQLPNIGLAKFNDLESGKTKWVNTSLKSVRKKYAKKQAEFDDKNLAKRQGKPLTFSDQFDAKTKDLFRRANVDYAEITTDKDYIKPLMNLFKRR